MTPGRPVPAASARMTPQRVGTWPIILVADLPPGLVTVGDGKVCCEAGTANLLVSTRRAYEDVLAAVTEAKSTMKTIMRDVSAYAPGKVVKTPRRTANGIKVLRDQVTTLLVELSAEGITDAQRDDCVVRYGRYRDAVAELRAAFLEAEAAFELVQARLVSVLGDLDEAVEQDAG